MAFLFKIFDISNIKRITFRKDINGLRAIAVLSVFFYHAEIEIFKGGWLGVDVFFVISGYLISNIIISELNEGTFSFKNFYIRRVRRILPALFSTLLLTIPFAYFLLTPKAMEEYIDSLIASVFFYANYHFMNVDFYIAESAQFMPLLHTWSLAIEEQYYILFPLVAFFVYKYFKKYFTFVIGFVTLGSIYLNTIYQSSDKFYRLEFRIWELLLGVLVMIISNNFKIKHLEKIGFPLMLFPIFYFGDARWINDIEPKLIALTGISLIIFSNTQSSILSKVLSFKIIYIIGLSSYSIYLLHQPLFAFYKIVLNKDVVFSMYFEDIPNSIDILNFQANNYLYENQYLFLFLLIIMTLLIGVYSYKYIELKLKKLNYISTIFGIILLIGAYLLLNPITHFENMTKNLNLTEEHFADNYSCLGTTFYDPITDLGNCFIENNSSQNLIILGDSSSVALVKSINENNKFTDFNKLFLTLSYKDFFVENFENCDNCIFDWIEERENVYIIVSVELHRFLEEEGIYPRDGYSGQDLSVFNSNFIKLSKISKQIVFIEPFPTILKTKPKPIDYLSQHPEVEEIYIKQSDWVDNTKKTQQILTSLSDTNENLLILKTKDLFCVNELNKCFIYKNNKLLYIDQHHLSLDGASLITNKLEKFLY